MRLEKELDEHIAVHPNEDQKSINYAILRIVEEAIREQVCTKSDLEILRLKSECQVKETEGSLRAEIRETQSQLRAEIKKTENELRAEIKETESQLRLEIKCVESQLKETEGKLRAEIKGSANELHSAINSLYGKIIASIGLGGAIIGGAIAATQLYINLKK
jgi:N-methylhydantoinase B/oxoprolinase/acetone carboxylase alpha subunit